MRKFGRIGAFVVLSCFSIATIAQTAPTLGGASSFAVLAGSTVTNTGPTVVAGDVGVSPGSAITGFPPGMLSTGMMHITDATAIQAQSDVTAAYTSLAGQTCGTDLTGTDLGGLTLTPGVYCFSSSAQLTGTLTLDAQGNAAAVFIFQIGSTLTTASNSTVSVINGGLDCNAYWQIGSSATLGTGTTFVGNILALTSISMNTGATISGRALARNGAVTLDSNTVALCGEACGTVTIRPASLTAATVGVAYSRQFSATGDIGPFVYSVTSGNLPAGLTLSPSGLLSGTPTTVSASTITIEANAPDGCAGTTTLTVTVGSTPVGPTTPTAVPALSLIGLMALAGLVFAFASLTLRQTRKVRRSASKD